jgi:hypothetical protein
MPLLSGQMYSSVNRLGYPAWQRIAKNAKQFVASDELAIFTRRAWVKNPETLLNAPFDGQDSPGAYAGHRA